MKKTLLFALTLFLSVSVFAQNRTSLLNESFNASSMPAGWQIMDLGSSNWSVSASQKAGGAPNEMLLNYNPSFNGTSRLVTPAVDLTGVSSVVFSFKHYLDNYSGSHTLGIATSSDNGATWNQAWSQVYSNDGNYVVAENVETADMGNSAVRFCIFYTGNSYNIDNWYFDDVEIFTLENLDLALNALTFPDFIGAGNLYPSMAVANKGVTAITSIEASYQVNDEEPVVETFDVNIASLANDIIEFTTPAVLIPGAYEITLTILNVNGTPDDDQSNNTMAKTVSVALGAAQMIPMIEHFSSSTCGPCVSVNTAMVNLTNNNPGKFTYTKYPMSWPGSGDPYYTTEGGTRRTYYGVSAVPQTFLDGADQGFAAVTQASLDNDYNTPAFAEIRGAYTIDGNTINITADLMSYIDLNNVRAYVSVNEKTTTGNVGSNGETSFHHIMMKMLPDAQGTTLSIEAGQYARLEFSFDMSTTHVEEMDDLEVSVWLQDHASKEIFNSHFMYENADHPYPAENLELVEDESGEENIMVLTWEAPAQGTPNGYNVYLNGELVLENTNELSYTFPAEVGMFYIAEVQALYNDDMTAVKAVAKKENTWTVGENTNTVCRMYPNPANTTVRIEANSTMQQVAIYDVLGNLVSSINVNGKSANISLGSLSNGVYFVNIIQAEGNSTQRLVVTH